MKTVLIVLALASAILLLAGCASIGASKSDGTLITGVLDKLLPPDFSGPIHLEHSNDYFKITIDGVDVRKVDGRWRWQSLEYDRQSSFPIFSGVVWKSTGKVRLGPNIPK